MIINDHCLLVIAMFINCVFWEKERESGESTAVNKQDFGLILLSHRIGGNRKRA